MKRLLPGKREGRQWQAAGSGSRRWQERAGRCGAVRQVARGNGEAGPPVGPLCILPLVFLQNVSSAGGPPAFPRPREQVEHSPERRNLSRGRQSPEERGVAGENTEEKQRREALLLHDASQ